MKKITYKEASAPHNQNNESAFYIESTEKGYVFILDVPLICRFQIGEVEKSHMSLRHRNRKNGFHLVSKNRWKHQK